MFRPSGSRSWLKLMLLVLSLPVTIAAFLIIYYPPIGRHSAQYSEATNSVVIHSISPLDVPSGTSLDLDLSTGAVRFANQRTPPIASGEGRIDRHPARTHFACEFAARFPNGKIDWVEFDFPVRPTQVAGRFVVGVDNSRIYWRDLSNSPGILHDRALSMNLQDCTIYALNDGSRRFVVHEWKSAKKAPVNNTAILFEMGDSGPRQLAQWPAGIDFSWFDGRFYCVGPGGKSVQTRDIEDGSDLGKLLLPRDLESRLVSRPQLRLGLIEDMLVVRRPTKTSYFFAHYDLRTLKAIGLGESPWVLARGNQPNQMSLFYKQDGSSRNAELMGFDRAKNQVAWKYTSIGEPTGFGRTEDAVIVITPNLGLTVDVIDLNSGAIKHRWQPFHWVAFAIPLVWVLFTAWLLCWLHVTAAYIPAWMNVSALSALILGLLMCYLLRWNFVPGYPRLPIFSYCYGIVVGLVASSLAWGALSRVRLTLRYLPAVGILTILLIVSRALFSMNQYFTIDAFVCATILGLLSWVSFLAIRLARFRWIQIESHARDGQKKANRPPGIPLRDLFMVLTATAALMASMRPVALQFGLPRVTSLVVIASACHTLGGALLVLTAQSRYAVRHGIGFGLSSTVLLCVSIESIYQFATDQPAFVDRMEYTAVVFRVVATSLLTLLVVLFGFRAQGWRLEHYSKNAKTEQGRV